MLLPASAWEPWMPGVFVGLPEETYRKAPGLSQSQLKVLRNHSPKHFLASLEEHRETTPDQLIGTLAHAMLLEPDKPLPRYAVRPEGMTGTSSEGRAWAKARRAEGLIILDRDEYAQAEGCAMGLAYHPCLRGLLLTGHSEVSVFAYLNDAQGRPAFMRCRLDFVPDANCLLDLKTTRDARDQAFARDIAKYGYYIQAAVYTDAWNTAMPDDPREGFVIAAVEKAKPYAVQAFNLATRALDRGRREYQSLLSVYNDCMESGHWPGYSDTFVPLDIPDYVYDSENT